MKKNDELVDTFHENYTESMSAANATTDGPEHTLEKIDALLSMGWEASAIEHIEQFERRTGINFKELAEECVGRHIRDPRGEN